MVEPLKTGELFVKEGLIRIHDIDMALSIQQRRRESLSVKKNRRSGMSLCDLSLITPVQNYAVLYKYNKLLSIQAILVLKKILTQEEILTAQNESQQADMPFISILLKNKLISTSQMQGVLFELYHIPFRSISDFIFNETDRDELVSVMDRHSARENRIIPLVLKDHTLFFGITDPENILFIQNLNGQYPQYRFKTLFIPFSGFSWFYNILYGSSKKALSSGKKAPDLSLLLSFKTVIKAPEQEKALVQTLYERYELLRQLTGNPKADSRLTAFGEFIVQSHRTISQDYQSHSIEYSLKKENNDVKVIAFPKR